MAAVYKGKIKVPAVTSATCPLGHAVCVAKRGEGERLVLLGWLRRTDKLRAKAVGISTRCGPKTQEVQVNGTISLISHTWLKFGLTFS